MNLDEYRRFRDENMPEKVFQERIRTIAELGGWLLYHTFDSRRSNPGWPDVVLAHPTGRVIIRELKTMRGRVSPRQREWLQALERAGLDVGVWRPCDIPEIERTLIPQPV